VQARARPLPLAPAARLRATMHRDQEDLQEGPSLGTQKHGHRQASAPTVRMQLRQ
jgi:hypothetical protein